MFIVQVYVKVHEKDINAFVEATKENASKSINETGILRFDFMQKDNAPDEFLLTEVYVDEKGAQDHKKTEHYLTWRETIADMMAIPRSSAKYREIYPMEKKAWVSN